MVQQYYTRDEYRFFETVSNSNFLIFLSFFFTRNAEPFKDRFFQPYSPVFIDGWVPPEIILPHQEAAAKSVARIQVRTFIFFNLCYF